MKQAAKEALSKNKSHYEQMKAIAQAYTTKRECFIQKAVCLVMLELSFPKVVFLNSNFPEKRHKIFKKKNETGELTDVSTDLFQRNMLDRYLVRPSESFKNGAYKVIDKPSLTELLSYHYIVKKPVRNSENDCQTELLDDTIMESNHAETHFSKVVPLM